MSTIWSRQFWKNTLELALFGAATGVGFALPDPQHPHWLQIATYAGAGALAWAAKGVLSNLKTVSALVGQQTGTPMLTAVHPKPLGHGWNPVDPFER